MRGIGIPEVEEDWANRLWEEIRRRASGEQPRHEVLFKEIDLDNGDIDMEIKSMYGKGLEKFDASKAETL